jgi:uncharacterized protein YndB with AHSA1/START domain
MNLSHWTAFTKRIPINSDAQKIYDFWAIPENLEKWFLKSALFTDDKGNAVSVKTPVKKGYKYQWLWHGYEDAVPETGSILEANGANFLKFTFADPCIVFITIKAENNMQILELKQEQIPVDDESKKNLYVGCGEGWTFYLTNLKSILEGGIDLRNKNTSVKKVINS